MNRREFLSQVACAFAVAGVGSRIVVAKADEPVRDKWWCLLTEGAVYERRWVALEDIEDQPFSTKNLPYSLIVTSTQFYGTCGL